uniref:Uncharacterized protein n=1 Tax=Aegilops tauschii TaxID=37682 RepID=M8BGZ3_AEGTA
MCYYSSPRVKNKLFFTRVQLDTGGCLSDNCVILLLAQLCWFTVRGSGGAGKQYTVALVSKWCRPVSAEHVARYLIADGSGGTGKHYTATPASKWCSSVLMSTQLTSSKRLGLR